MDTHDGWTLEVRERSAGVYEGVATHKSGLTIRLTGDDDLELLERLRTAVDQLMLPSRSANDLKKSQEQWVHAHERITATEQHCIYIRANLCLTAPEDGGRRTPMASSYRAHWAFPPDVHSERHDAPITFEVGPHEWLAPGGQTLVRIHPLVPDLWEGIPLSQGLVLTMLEGARVIGTATVIEVVDPRS